MFYYSDEYCSFIDGFRIVDVLNDIDASLLHTSNRNHTETVVFPNPTKGLLNIVLENFDRLPGTFNVIISDLNGVELLS